MMGHSIRRANLATTMWFAAAALCLQPATGQQADTRIDHAGAVIDIHDANALKMHSHKNKGVVYVDCSNPLAKVKTIAAGLSLLTDARPAVLFITGTCHEDVVIAGLDRVTLQGNPAATIDGGSDPSVGTVEISDSNDISLVNLTITGGGEGVGCFGQSLCRLFQVTVQNSLADGIGVGNNCFLGLLDSVIQNNSDVGILLGAGHVAFFGGVVSGNSSHGVIVGNGGSLGLGGGTVYADVSIQNNGGNGITALHSSVNLNPGMITGNSGDGVSLQGESAINMIGSTITSNLGHQVRIGDLSFARFTGYLSNTVSGGNSPDVVCDPVYSTTRRFSNLSGTTTNCPAELPPAP